MADALGPLAPYRKTVVAVVGAVIVSLTAALTLTGLPLVIAIVTAVAVAFGVFKTPNAGA